MAKYAFSVPDSRSQINGVAEFVRPGDFNVDTLNSSISVLIAVSTLLKIHLVFKSDTSESEIEEEKISANNEKSVNEIDDQKWIK